MSRFTFSEAETREMQSRAAATAFTAGREILAARGATPSWLMACRMLIRSGCEIAGDDSLPWPGSREELAAQADATRTWLTEAEKPDERARSVTDEMMRIGGTLASIVHAEEAPLLEECDEIIADWRKVNAALIAPGPPHRRADDFWDEVK